MSKEYEYKWHDLKETPPPLGRSILLYPFIIDVGHIYRETIYSVSNPEYARLHAIEKGYTHWMPILPGPDEDAVQKKIEKIYEPEQVEAEKFMEGFNRASENIVEVLKELLPDRRAVVEAIQK